MLQKKGSTRRFRYRFVNPLLQPYVIMKGLSEDLIEPIALQRVSSGQLRWAKVRAKVHDNVPGVVLRFEA